MSNKVYTDAEPLLKGYTNQPLEWYHGKYPFYAHPSPTIDNPSMIGQGTKVWHYSHVMDGAKIGRDCMLGQNTFVGAQATIGDRVRIQNNVSVYGGVTLEDDVFCGP